MILQGKKIHNVLLTEKKEKVKMMVTKFVAHWNYLGNLKKLTDAMSPPPDILVYWYECNLGIGFFKSTPPILMCSKV